MASMFGRGFDSRQLHKKDASDYFGNRCVFLFPYTVVNNLIITLLIDKKYIIVHTWFIYLHFIFVHIFQCDIVFLYLCVWKERQMVHLSNDRQMLLMLYFQKRCHCEERITILKGNNRKYFFEIVVSDC